ncbi:MAG: hypothetical protein AAFU34_16905 [Pseudomonadota bacterium]
MLAKDLVGSQAAARKYDLISAMGAFALGQGTTEQRVILRFITIITARYNWQSAELSVGQQDMARLWNVTTRTVKREIGWLRRKGWLVTTRQGSRGTVSRYRLGLDRILEDTAPFWPAVGPDFVVRMSARTEIDPQKVVTVDFQAREIAEQATDPRWADALRALHTLDPTGYASWYVKLGFVSFHEGCLTVSAPNSFVRTYVETHLRHFLLAQAAATFKGINVLRVVETR